MVVLEGVSLYRPIPKQPEIDENINECKNWSQSVIPFYSYWSFRQLLTECSEVYFTQRDGIQNKWITIEVQLKKRNKLEIKLLIQT